MLLGVPAKEIHLCGEESVISAVRSIAESVGDTVEVRDSVDHLEIDYVLYCSTGYFVKNEKSRILHFYNFY